MSIVASEREQRTDQSSDALPGDLRSGACPLPSRIKALYITGQHQSGAWLAEALAAECESHLNFQESTGAIDGAARLRDEAFDVVFINHLPGEMDAFAFTAGLRSGGCDAPMLVLGTASERELASAAYEAGSDAYLCVGNTTTRTLAWTVARAIERHALLRENDRLRQSHQQRLEHEHQEAGRLLADQRLLVRELKGLASDDAIKTAGFSNQRGESDHPPAVKSPDGLTLPPQLVAFYREMLRAYVIMGAGNLSAEMGHLAELLVGTDVSAQQAMLLHLGAVEELVRGLGSRSARHVMVRADLLILELMIHLADGYRGRYLGHGSEQQLTLQGLC